MATEQNTPTNLLDFSREGLKTYLHTLGEKPFRATQILKWVHQMGVRDFSAMSNLSKSLRDKLQKTATLMVPNITFEERSQDGTVKWLMGLADGNCIETVFIPEGDRGTLCVSSQVGCALNCSFCSTGKQGFNRNLTVSEIIGQVWVAEHRLRAQTPHLTRAVTNVVMMGMGEPLLNFDNVVTAMDLMMEDFAYGLSKRRVTLSTSGVIPAMKQLKAVSDVALAVSLHAPNDRLRNELVPINKKYPINDLMEVCRNYFDKTSRRYVTFEYVMLKDVNDSDQNARELTKIAQGIPCKFNLIPFNPFPFTHYERSSDERIERFGRILMKAGYNCITRKTRGEDIDAACGQLVGKVEDKTSRSRLHQIKIQKEVFMENGEV